LASRLLSVFPVLYGSGSGLRASLLPTINLAQMSEFSLVIAALGLSLGHIDAGTVAVLTFAFALTSVSSTYMIAYNHELQAWLARLLVRLGLKDRGGQPAEGVGAPAATLAFLGFYRDASSILHQFEIEEEGSEAPALLREVLVIDFNPVVLDELKRRGIRSLYGDVSSMDTLHHADVHGVRLIACTLTDSVLKGTTNARLLKQLRRLSPEALLVMASDTLEGALDLYAAGADFVFVPRIHSAHRMAEVLRTGLEEDLEVVRRESCRAARAGRGPGLTGRSIASASPRGGPIPARSRPRARGAGPRSRAFLVSAARARARTRLVEAADLGEEVAARSAAGDSS
jgi:hypothetical protein